MNISDEAVEAVAKYLGERFFWDSPLLSEVAREVLDAAAPILLSHEREQTRLAHIDAVVNAQTVDRLEAELEHARIEAWERGREDGYHHRPNPYKEAGE